MTNKKLILIDLDGVLNEYKGDYKKDFIHPPKTETKDFLKALSKNFEIKIFTTRNLLLTSKWLIKYNLDKYIKDVTNIKEKGSFLFVDDRCICFKNDYEKLLSDIENFKEHWK